MKTKIQNFILFSCLFMLSQQFMSCKKNNDVSGNIINANSTDNTGINKLPADSSLVAWYNFNKGSLADKSGKHNNISFCSATPTASKSGKENSAYYFDGSSSYMVVKNSPSLNPAQAITLAVLIKPMSFYHGKCHGNRILYKGGTSGDYEPGRYYLGFDDQAYWNYNGCDQVVQEDHENFIGSYGDGLMANDIVNTDYIKLNKWYSLVYTCDGINSKMYINNKLKDSAKLATAFTPNGNDLYIGKTAFQFYPYYFNGVIDELRIYNRALSTEEVLGLNTLMGND